MKCSRADDGEGQQCRGRAVGQRKCSSAQARQRRIRIKRARATLRDKVGGSLCQGQGGVARVSPL